MSIASEISRLQTAKADLKTAINAKTDAQHQITTETLDDYADFVDSIQTGGGGDTTDLKNMIQRTGTSITIPDDITSIGNGAFYGYAGLTSITIPNTVTSIGNSAFNSCTGLTSITIPSGVTSIGTSAFMSCSGLTSISIPNTVTSLGNTVIYNCSSLTSVTVPDSVTSIGTQFCVNCTNLETVTIGKGVTTIGTNWLQNCSKLTTLNYNATSLNDFSSYSNHWQNVGSSGNGITLNIGDDVTKLPTYFIYPQMSTYSPNITTINFGEKLRTIGRGALYNLNKVQVVNFNSKEAYGSGSTTIYIAHPSSGTLTINIGDNVTHLNNYIFSSIYADTINIGSGVTNIAMNAFRQSGVNNTYLTKITITATTPPTLEYNDVFAGYPNLATIEVPSASLTAYQTANRWSQYASLMVGV